MVLIGLALQALIATTTGAFWPTVDRSSATSVANGFFPNTSHVEIDGSRTAGRFSVATFQHGQIEGRFANQQLLLEKFDFGWQVIELSHGSRFTTRDLQLHGISAADARELLHGNIPGRSFWCSSDCKDHGPSNDIEEVRKLMLYFQGEAIGPVKVDSGWALLNWRDRGGGQALFAKRGGQWERISEGGGCLQLSDLEKYGMPLFVAQRFEQWNPCG
jgi:hypothetical protein